jgi:hypothetical protein
VVPLIVKEFPQFFDEGELWFQTQMYMEYPWSEMKFVFAAAVDWWNVNATPSLRNSSAPHACSWEVLSTPARSPLPSLSSHAEHAGGGVVSAV